jgi:S1-C subfamily serine protease
MAKPKIPPSQVAQQAPSGVKPRLVGLSRFGTQMDDADKVGVIGYSVLCVTAEDLRWGDIRLTGKELTREFNSVMKSGGFAVEGDPDDLFAKNESAAEFDIAAMVKSVRGDICEASSISTKRKAYAFVDVEWQVYSNLKREVVAKISTTGAFDQTTPLQDGAMTTAIVGAFGDNARALINNAAFRQLVLAPGGSSATQSAASTSTSTPDRTPLELGKLSAKPSGLPDVVGSVVTVYSGGAHGSAFLISDQGYLITNQHVTAGAKTVRLRWSDGFESTGEVLREHKLRDVALIKADSRGRIPLNLKRGTVPVGTEVYAVGSPLDDKMQGTVTRGIVSTSSRIFEGYAFVQSDVTVSPGNSGGPLVTKEGDVVAVTDLGFQPDGLPTGINLFIPAGDVLDFMGLKAATP